MNRKQFSVYLATKAHTEEDVKHAYLKHFRIESSTQNRNDCRTDNVLFEFKFNKNLKAPKQLATVIAQALYYVQRCKVGTVKDTLPLVFAVCDVNEAALFVTDDWKTLYDAKYDWNRAPSSPDPRLVADVQKHPAFLNEKTHVFDLLNEAELTEFSERLRECMVNIGTRDKKYITTFNFEDVFEHWKQTIGQHIDAKDLASYYVQDLQHTTTYDVERCILTFKEGQQHVPSKDYMFFWTLYIRPPSAADMEGILSKADRLNHMEKRRFNGEFYTPLVFGKRGIEYLTATLGDEWWTKCKFWDMAAGTGNLEYHIPSYENVYMSTLDKNEVTYLRDNGLFPGATVFQYDYLNDDVALVMKGADLLDDSQGWKMPRKLREDLADHNNKWVVLINPPFADQGSGINTGAGKKGVSAGTKMQSHMKQAGMGKAGRELFVQFLTRIMKEMPTVVLGIHSPLKYINAPASEAFRKTAFTAKFERGFVYPSMVFAGVKGKWPVGFAIWRKQEAPLGNASVTFDVLDKEGNKTGMKTVTAETAEKYLNKWVDRPEATEVAPPLTSAIKLAVDDRSGKMAPESLGWMLAHCNDVLSTGQLTALFSSDSPTNHGGWSITPDNFEKSIVTFAVRRLVKDTWTNHCDQFKQPTKGLTSEFVTDCLVWMLFDGKNQSSSLKDVAYKGKTYQIRNQFVPFTVAELRAMPLKDMGINAQLRTAKDTFVATWLKDKTLSPEAQEVMRIGKAIWSLFFENYTKLSQVKFKLAYWDVGWYQVRNALADDNLGEELFAQMDVAKAALTAKLRPQVYDLGFLDREVDLGSSE